MTDAMHDDEELRATTAVTLPQRSNISMAAMGVGIAALAVGIWLSVRSSSAPHEPTTAASPATSDVSGPGPMVNLDSLVVNLSDLDELHYLKCTVAVELVDAAAVQQFERQNVRIRNSLLLYLSNLTLADTMGSENKLKIQATLRDRITEIADGNLVKAIYLTEFVLQ